ncbi:MAG: GNAT family N-acetyltransferase [Dongiaceae bacterium]
MVTIRRRAPGDDGALVRLFEEMQAYYRRPCPPAESILNDLAALPTGITILVAAAEDGEIVGFAAFSAIYPGPGLAPGLFLKELFVSERFRHAGIGSRLLRAVAAFAVEHGYKRVDWTSDRNSPALLAYYEGFGALKQDDKAFFRLTGAALDTLAGDGKS